MRVPRQLREAVERLSASLDRAPRPSEIAAYLDMSVEPVLEA
jgi:DNA-directed RNA polymerase specialized sigma subunit